MHSRCPHWVNAVRFLPVIINKLSSRHPRLTFRVSQAPTGTALNRELRERNVDLILGKVAMPPTKADLNHEILFDEKQLVVRGAFNQCPLCPQSGH